MSSPRFATFDYLNGRGGNDIERWTRGLEKRQQTKLLAAVDRLELLGAPALTRSMILPLGGGLWKLKVGCGDLELRPHLCEGPLGDYEYTFLIGAIEKGDQLRPPDVEERARARREEIRADPRRRCRHVEVDPTAEEPIQ